MRKLMVVLLSGIICLLAVNLTFAQDVQDIKIYPTVTEYEQLTGKKIGEFNESPLSKVMVAAGELPLLKERLPKEPSVIEPLEEIGQYGGTLRFCYDPRMIRHHALFMRSNDGSKIILDLATGYEYSEDYRILTIYLREGTRWSDGAPFTVDDILFWWEDTMLNEELNPSGPWSPWKQGDSIAEFEKVDDYTLRIHWPEPAPGVMAAISHPWGASQTHFFDPKDYLKKWHIKYNPEADELAEEEGYKNWWEAFAYHQAAWMPDQRVGLPTLNTWMLTKMTSSYRVFKRNPYFWQVDTAGNQLPYIDELVYFEIPDSETRIMKAISGELDFVAGGGGSELTLDNYPLCKEHEEEGDYRVVVGQSMFKTAMVLTLNPFVPDLVLQKIFNDIRFRQALSIAIDREGINDAVYFGLAKPRQWGILPGASFYKDEWSNYYTEYDIERANVFLDEMGLNWDSEHKYRLRSDGKILDILVESGHGSEEEATIAELIGGQWQDIGIKLTIKTEKTANERITNDLCEILICNAGGGSTELDAVGGEEYFGQLGRGWNNWFASDGKIGVEPPDEWKEHAELIDRSRTISSDTEEWKRLKEQIWDFKVKQLYQIGTVYKAPTFDIVKNYLRNYPEGFWMGWAVGMYVTFQSQQWFIKK